MLFLAEATTTNWEVCKSKMQPPSSLGCICLTLQASRGYDSIYGHQEPPPLLAKMCNCGITRFLTSSLTGGERKVKYLPYLVAYSKIFSIGNLKSWSTGSSSRIYCQWKKWQTSILEILRKDTELCPLISCLDLAQSHQNWYLETGCCAYQNHRIIINPRVASVGRRARRNTNCRRQFTPVAPQPG